MVGVNEIRKSFLITLWFLLLSFPILVIKADPISRTINWRWRNLVLLFFSVFGLCLFFQVLAKRKRGRATTSAQQHTRNASWLAGLKEDQRIGRALIALAALFFLLFPFLFSTYQINIMTTALIYVVLGLGLNIVVGFAGLLDLGYVAFYAVGAYSYALLQHHFGLGFWLALPIGAGLGALFGILLGFPVLRLRGDYLAIVTLGFGEIIRLILENWNEFSFGPSGIANIPRPSLWGLNLDLDGSIKFTYFLLLLLVCLTIVSVDRLRNSRIGRAWLALREDEIACQAMGIDKTKTKLTAFALGATWAGMAGVLFAAKTTFINPASFTFLESAIILSIVVLGGMGSVVGVIMAALLLILLPEYLRVFENYRMLLFGAVMVAMMIFRPQGIIGKVKRRYAFDIKKLAGGEKSDSPLP